MGWIITNIPKENSEILESGEIYIDNIYFTKPAVDQPIEIYIEGYIIPRQSVYEKYKSVKRANLIIALYYAYGDDFIHYIKGIFILIIRINRSIKIYTDRHAIKKVFYWIEEDRFIFSNSIDLIKSRILPEPDIESLAMFCLMEHFVYGYTAFRDIFHSLPATTIYISNDIKISRYWLPQELFRIKVGKKRSYEIIARSWQQLILTYIHYLGPSEIALTLTGGNDSRMVLAALNNSNVKLKTFSFGNPDSIDCKIAKEIAISSDIKYSVFNAEGIDSKVYSELTDKIDELGNTIINLHRAHRLYAIREFSNDNPYSEMLFTGLMGGEYIKGIQYDDYIIPKFIRKFEESGGKNMQQIVESLLDDCRIEAKEVDLPRLIELIHQLDFLKVHPRKNREFLYAYYIYGCAHHYQDSTIFQEFSKILVNPFMDIDILELLAENQSLSFQTEKNCFLTKLYRSKIQVMPTHLLTPELSDIPYAKRGLYTANDMLGNPFQYMIKRVIQFKKSKKFVPNFSYESWFNTYCQNELLNIHPVVKRLFRIGQLSNEMNYANEIKTEGKWHKYTNPINLSRLLNRYEKI